MNDDPGTIDRLARIETTLAQLVKQLDKELSSYETRLTRVERVMWVSLGMAIAAGAPNYVQLLS